MCCVNFRKHSGRKHLLYCKHNCGTYTKNTKNEMFQCLNSERSTAELLVTDFAEFSTRTVSYFLLNFRDQFKLFCLLMQPRKPH